MGLCYEHLTYVDRLSIEEGLRARAIASDERSGQAPPLEPPRLSRRLLSVRRGHDECYKEQVFV
jgi:hypothetical protein